MKSEWKSFLIWLLFLAVACSALQTILAERSHVSFLKEYTCETWEFRQQHLPAELSDQIKELERTDRNFSEILTVTMLEGKFFPRIIFTDSSLYRKYKPEEYELLKKAYQAVWEDVDCFPVPAEDIFYEDTFGEERLYGGERIHEGTDLFGKVKKAGYYPVLSMTGGTIEKMGWLPLGGYRVGIRSPHGGYFYYAHLSEYEKNIKEGKKVHAGDILGFMGNTGYGEMGTSGKFPVHLHLGIYILSPDEKELSVNPYWILNSVKKKTRNYRY